MLKNLIISLFLFLSINSVFASEKVEVFKDNQSIYLSDKSFQEIFIDNIEKDYLYINQIKEVIIEKDSYSRMEFQTAVKNILITNKTPEKRANRISIFLTKMTYEESSFNLYFYNKFINLANLSAIVKKGLILY